RVSHLVASARSVWLDLILVTLVLVLFVRPVHAQISGNYVYDSSKHAYFVHGDTTVDGSIAGNDVFVGKDNASSFTTLDPSPPITLSVINAGAMDYYQYYPGTLYPDGNHYFGLNLFGHNKVNITSGGADQVFTRDASTLNITGGGPFSSDVGQAF